MKNNILKRIGCAVLAGTLLLSLVSCKDKTDVVIKDMEKETVHSLGLDFLGGKDVGRCWRMSALMLALLAQPVGRC